LEFNVPFQHKYGYIRDDNVTIKLSSKNTDSNFSLTSIFTVQRSYASAVLGVVILSVRPSVCLSHACFVTNPKYLPATFLYHMKGQSF